MSAMNSQLNSRRNSIHTNSDKPQTPASNPFTTPTRLSRAVSQDERRPYSYFPAVAGRHLLMSLHTQRLTCVQVCTFLDKGSLKARVSRVESTRNHGPEFQNLERSGKKSSSGHQLPSDFFSAVSFASYPLPPLPITRCVPHQRADDQLLTIESTACWWKTTSKASTRVSGVMRSSGEASGPDHSSGQQMTQRMRTWTAKVSISSRHLLPKLHRSPSKS